MSESIFEPPVPPDCDLRGMPFMPLDVVRLVDSDLAALSTGDEFKAAVILWCKAWAQIPAASLPNDDRILARLAGLSLSEWQIVREAALRGFIECSDGRLYHAVIAEKAAEAWAHRQKQRDRANKRWGKDGDTPPSGGKSDSADATAMPRHSHGNASAQVRGNARDSKGTGTVNISPSATRDADQVFARCVAAGGPGLADPARTPSLHTTAPRIAAALAAGCDLDLDVLHVIADRTAKARASPVSTWSYFDAAWADARDKRLALAANPDPQRFADGTDNGRNRDAKPARRGAGAQRQIRHAAWVDVLEEAGEVEAVGRRAAAD